jgi:hypothetical protein
LYSGQIAGKNWGARMSLTDLLWLATAAYGVHILEEYQLNWRD